MLLMCYVAFIYIISYGNHLSYFSMEKNEKKNKKTKKTWTKVQKEYKSEYTQE